MEEQKIIVGDTRLFCDKENIKNYVENIMLQLRLENGFFNNSIADSDIVLGEAFGDLKISSLVLENDCLNLELTGKIKKVEPWSITYGTIIILKSGMADGIEDLAVLIDVVTPSLKICYAEIKKDGNRITIPVTIQDGEFGEVSNIEFGDFKVEDIEFVDNSTINIHILCSEEEKIESILDGMPDTILKVCQKINGEELKLEAVFSVPEKYVNFDFLFKTLENFDENSEYENGYTGILTLGFRLSTNGRFENNICDYVKLSNDFTGGSVHLKYMDKNACEIEVLIALDVDNSGDFWGMILNGSIVLEKGFACSEWGAPLSESVYSYEVMLHDQFGGVSDVCEEISAITSKYADTFSTIGEIVSSASTIFDFSIQFAELVGWKESTVSVLKDIRNELGELKEISQQTLITVNWIKNKMIADTNYSIVANFNIELENLNSSCTQMFNTLHDNMGLIKINSNEKEISAAFQKGLNVVIERYGSRLEELISSYNLLMERLTGTITGLPQEINPFSASDILINEQFNWDSEAQPLRNLYRTYVGNILTKGYLILKAMSLIIQNNQSNVEYLDGIYSNIISYIKSHQPDEKQREDGAAYNLVLGKYISIKEGEISESNINSSLFESLYKTLYGSEKQYAEMLRRTKNKRLYNNRMIELGTDKMKGELKYIFGNDYLIDHDDFLCYKADIVKDAMAIIEISGKGIALNTDCIEQHILFDWYIYGKFINNTFCKKFNKKFLYFQPI